MHQKSSKSSAAKIPKMSYIEPEIILDQRLPINAKTPDNRYIISIPLKKSSFNNKVTYTTNSVKHQELLSQILKRQISINLNLTWGGEKKRKYTKSYKQPLSHPDPVLAESQNKKRNSKKRIDKLEIPQSSKMPESSKIPLSSEIPENSKIPESSKIRQSSNHEMKSHDIDIEEIDLSPIKKITIEEPVTKIPSADQNIFSFWCHWCSFGFKNVTELISHRESQHSPNRETSLVPNNSRRVTRNSCNVPSPIVVPKDEESQKVLANTADNESRSQNVVPSTANNEISSQNVVANTADNEDSSQNVVPNTANNVSSSQNVVSVVSNPPDNKKSSQNEVANDECEVVFVTKEKRLRCAFCTDSFDSKRNLMMHSATTHFNKMPNIPKPSTDIQLQETKQAMPTVAAAESNLRTVKCAFCPESFERFKELMEHSASEHFNKPTAEPNQTMTCKICSESFPSVNLLMLHSASAHLKPGVQKEQFNCVFCPMSFDNREELMEHSSATHLKKVIDNVDVASSSTNVNQNEDQSNTSEPFMDTLSFGPLSFKCVICFRSFPKKFGLHIHMKKIHNSSAHSIETTKVSMQQDRNTSNKTQTLKDQDSSGLDGPHGNTLQQLNIQEIPRSSPYHCQLCEESFSTEMMLSRHTYQNHTETQDTKAPGKTCDICFQYFGTRKEIRIHRAIAHGIKPASRDKYKCSECLTSFPSKAGLAAHFSKDHASQYNITEIEDQAVISPIFPNNFTLQQQNKNTPMELETSPYVRPIEFEKLTNPVTLMSSVPLSISQDLSRHEFVPNLVHSSQKITNTQKGQIKAVKTKTIGCAHCPQTFHYKYQLVKHSAKFHSSNQDGTNSTGDRMTSSFDDSNSNSNNSVISSEVSFLSNEPVQLDSQNQFTRNFQKQGIGKKLDTFCKIRFRLEFVYFIVNIFKFKKFISNCHVSICQVRLDL